MRVEIIQRKTNTMYHLHVVSNPHPPPQKKKKQNPERIDTKNRLGVTRDGDGRWAKWMKVIKRYKLPITK